MATKLVNRDAFMDVMQSIWRVNEGVEIEPVEGNVFAFHFRNVEDRKRIQTCGPWSFDRAMIVFEEPTDIGEVSNLKMIGQVQDIDMGMATDSSGRYVRVRVVVNTKDLLIRSIRVDLMGDGQIKTLLLRYERLMDYCFKCGRLEHSLRECVESGEVKVIISEAQMRLNVWLRAQNSWRNDEDWRGKTRGRSEIATGIQMRGEDCSEIQRRGMRRYVPPKTCMGTNTSINGINGTVRKETSLSNVSGEVIIAKSNDEHLEDIIVDEGATMGGTQDQMGCKREELEERGVESSFEKRVKKDGNSMDESSNQAKISGMVADRKLQSSVFEPKKGMAKVCEEVQVEAKLLRWLPVPQFHRQ
ncbi:hypothetical protein EZV62_005405 [Acer yangbiense]|uniref:DUF4283 domain-containing protein n=1 Tax=Acer yangbiense TaxID=1000413 RepID=A0A5C7IMN6_9ROSI|nr:hypothetical protein EZV62_005405 [Acer yangbiense]